MLLHYWSLLLIFYHEASLIRGNRANCALFCDNLDWLVSKLDRLEASSGLCNFASSLFASSVLKSPFKYDSGTDVLKGHFKYKQWGVCFYTLCCVFWNRNPGSFILCSHWKSRGSKHYPGESHQINHFSFGQAWAQPQGQIRTSIWLCSWSFLIFMDACCCQVLDVLCSLCVCNGVAVRSNQNLITENLLPGRDLLLQTSIINYVTR